MSDGKVVPTFPAIACAGLALIATTGLLVAPLLHSFVQRLHVARGG